MDIDEILSNGSMRKLVGGAIGISLGLLIWGGKLLFQSIFRSNRKSRRDEAEKYR